MSDLATRLREISDAIADGNRDELTMRVPAEPDRDADLVVSRAADEIEHLRRERDELRALLLCARDDYDSDLMAVGHAPDSPARTRTMQRLRGRITAIDAALAKEER